MNFLRSPKVQALIFGLVLAGCRDPETKALHSVVDGRWESVCIPRQDVFGSYRLALNFAEAKDVVRREDYFADSNCQNALASLSYQGEFQLMVTSRDYFYSIDLFFTSLALKATTETGRQLLGQTGYCGVTQWTIFKDEVPQKFEPSSCAALGPPPLKNLNMVRVSRGQSLSFGGVLANENERPIDVDLLLPELLFTAQPIF